MVGGRAKRQTSSLVRSPPSRPRRVSFGLRRSRGAPGVPRTSVATNSRFKNGKRFAANVRIAEIGGLGGLSGTGERRTVGRRRSARIGFGNKPKRANVGRLVGDVRRESDSAINPTGRTSGGWSAAVARTGLGKINKIGEGRTGERRRSARWNEHNIC